MEKGRDTDEKKEIGEEMEETEGKREKSRELKS